MRTPEEIADEIWEEMNEFPSYFGKGKDLLEIAIERARAEGREEGLREAMDICDCITAREKIRAALRNSK